MSDEGEDQAQERAARVRDRRNRRSRRSREAENEDQSEQTSEMSQTEESSQMSQTEATTRDEPTPDQQPIKERTHETFYLRNDLRHELRRITGQANLDFEMAYGIELEKNRHLRPLLLYLGAQKLDDMAPEDVRDVLENTDVLDEVDTSE